MNQSAQLFSRARSVIPGGVNSPVRAFRNVDGDPFFVQSAKGAYITDADGRQLIDYIGTWGPAILGHAPQPVLDAVHAAVDRGLGYGIPAPAEVDMAEMITDMVPSVEKVRMVNSGTEATMSAIRLARGYTGRRKIHRLLPRPCGLPSGGGGFRSAHLRRTGQRGRAQGNDAAHPHRALQ